MKPRKPDKSQSPMPSDTTVDNPKSGLDREIQAKIGQKLRAMYDDIVQEGVPERFAELLRKLDKPSGEEGQP
ncbi:MAG: hypothetical protein HY659_12725 [Rhizobiales bacterium]|nr:hypothetical protein [Hyphomicrobiales bacterium]